MSKSIISEGERYRVEAESVGGEHTLRPIGKIDEDFRFQDLDVYLADFKGRVSKVIFDLGQVTDLNSCGVRAWLLFVQKMPAIADVEFSVLGETFIEQANIVTNMLGKSNYRVHAIQVPYFCADCDVRTMLTFKVSDVPVLNGERMAPESKCRTCSKPLQFDSHPEEYFAHLKARA